MLRRENARLSKRDTTLRYLSSARTTKAALQGRFRRRFPKNPYPVQDWGNLAIVAASSQRPWRLAGGYARFRLCRYRTGIHIQTRMYTAVSFGRRERLLTSRPGYFTVVLRPNEFRPVQASNVPTLPHWVAPCVCADVGGLNGLRSLALICKDCGVRMEVVRTMSLADRTIRLNECPCGTRFETEEKFTRRLPVAHRQHTGSLPVNTGNLTSVLKSSDPDLSALSDSAPSSKPPESDAHARKSKGRPNLKGYTSAFETFWHGCVDAGRGKGNKWPAFKFFDRLKPDPIKTFECWNRWMLTPQWRGGHNPDVSSWLNARAFESDPTAANMRPGEAADRGPRSTELDLRP